MEVKVYLRNLRTAPRKVRQMADVIRNKNIPQARALLEFTVKRSADPILKLLNSAVASAVNDLKLEEANLTISEIRVDEGPKLKRSHPMSRGRAYPIIKRTSQIMIVVKEIKPTDSNKKNKVSATVNSPRVAKGESTIPETKVKAKKVKKPAVK
jgi:large subunit ribosomal protein L22